MVIREREDLLGSVRKDIESYKSGSGVNNRRTELFLKEHEHLRNSDRLIDDTISIAMATKENMTSQRGMLKSIQSRVNTLANRFPAINNLIQRINLRKRRDSLILGGVIGICTILLLLYAFHWWTWMLTNFFGGCSAEQWSSLENGLHERWTIGATKQIPTWPSLVTGLIAASMDLICI